MNCAVCNVNPQACHHNPWKPVRFIKHEPEDKRTEFEFADDVVELHVWYVDGKLHREGGLPAFIACDGSQTWFRNGVAVRSIEPGHGGKLEVVYYTDGKEVARRPMSCLVKAVRK